MSCGSSGTGETPQDAQRRGGSPPARGKQVTAAEINGQII
ncbi:hypothetical protein PBF_13794 [Cytobacillus firmus DS1]|uniref:Uncharacterized protein n=1 Tax=Cytobacillus firmus DS1 TaxID=1307436 RepID=W7L5V5_CYTFI|nr:hypothetical protein PBF_13794 [Cytobacillus firmus DS1]